MIIKLPHIAPIDTNNVPDDLETLVRESFKNFTRGTAKDYQFEDKLLYLDNLRKIYLGRPQDANSAVKELIGDYVHYQLNEYNEMPETEDILSIEFMEVCYNAGFLPLRRQFSDSSSNNTRILKVILRIITAVVTYEEVSDDEN